MTKQPVLSLLCADGGLSFPSGVTMCGSDVYIADMGNACICSVDGITGQSKGRIHSPLLQKPLALTFHQGFFVVADAGQNALFCLKEGRIAPLFTGRVLQLPGSVAFSGGRLYVAEFHRNRILAAYAGNLHPVTTIDCQKPYGLCAGDGCLFVTDTERNRILSYDPVRRQCTPLSGELDHPCALAYHARRGLVVSTGRRLWRYLKERPGFECLLDQEAFHEAGLPYPGHLGALCFTVEGSLVCSDTIRNTLYRLDW